MKTLSRLLVCTFIVLAGMTTVKAQDIHFSQFYMSPLNLNPAMTGVMNCKTRFVANYRNQWASVLKANAYNTYSASYDQKVPVGREDYFESLYTKATIHAGAQFPIQPKISLLPYIVYMAQGEHVEFNGGASVRFALGPSRLSNQSWQLGAWYRLGSKDEGGIHSDAVILSTRFDYENFGIGFSYDVNVSKLSSAGTANGAFEFSLQYLICGPENRGVYCPRF